MNVESMIAAAATSIGEAAPQSLSTGLHALEAEYQRRMRNDIERARTESLIDSLDFEPAARELAQQHEQQGNLRSAARWYRVAARGDLGDAALRLGVVLDLLADRTSRHKGSSTYSNQRDELFLIREAAQAYAEAYAAGYPEAAEKIDDMFTALEQRQNRTITGDRATSSRPERECAYVHDRAAEHSVLRDTDITRLSQHAARCVPCLKALIARAIKDASTVPSGNLTFTSETDKNSCNESAAPSSPSPTALHFSGAGP